MPEQQRPLKVFLCHASADKPKVRDLYRFLKRRGIQPWLDAEDLLPGQTWQVEIPKAIETSDAIIIFLSQESVDKEGYVQKEIKFALDRALEMPEGRIFIIPARLEECDVPRSISGYHWVDLFNDSGYDKLMKSLKVRAAQLERSNVNAPHKKDIEPDATEKKFYKIKEKIRLKTTNLENVLVFLQNRLEKVDPKYKERAVTLDNFSDDITRTITYIDPLNRPFRDKNSLVVKCDPFMTVVPGETDKNVKEVKNFHSYDALVFTGWETQTVFLELEFDKNWQELANSLVDELYNLFGNYDDEGIPNAKSIPSSKPESPQNISILVDGNVQGNIIIENENAIQTLPTQKDENIIQSLEERRKELLALQDKAFKYEASGKKQEALKIYEEIRASVILLNLNDIDIDTKITALKLELNSFRQKPPRKLKTEYIVAIIGLIGTLLAALIGILPQIIKPVPAPTATISPTTALVQVSPSTFPTPEPSLTPADTLTPTPLLTEIIDDQGISMRFVPAGEFIMGSDNGQNDEKPPHSVALGGYYMDVYEVTNGLYKNCVDADVCTSPSNTKSKTRDFYYGDPAYDNYPVIYVDWNQAKTYCEWREARLPNEAEWEKAARGTDGWTYPWGDVFDGKRINFCDKNCSLDWAETFYDDGYADTAPIGSYEMGKSIYGLYDMSGNAAEWTADMYSAYPGGTLDVNDSTAQSYRVFRGGAWYYIVDNLRISNRGWSTPDSIDSGIGFRCARDTQP